MEEKILISLENPIRANSFNQVLASILDAVVTILVPIVVLMVLYTGVKLVYASFQGDPKGIAEARTAILWALLGALIILSITGIRTVLENTATQIRTEGNINIADGDINNSSLIKKIMYSIDKVFISNILKKAIYVFIFFIALYPFIIDAQSLSRLANNIVNFLQTVNIFAIALGFLFFTYNGMRYILLSTDSSKRGSIRDGMLYSLIAIAVLVSLFGIIEVFTAFISLDAS